MIRQSILGAGALCLLACGNGEGAVEDAAPEFQADAVTFAFTPEATAEGGCVVRSRAYQNTDPVLDFIRYQQTFSVPGHTDVFETGARPTSMEDTVKFLQDENDRTFSRESSALLNFVKPCNEVVITLSELVCESDDFSSAGGAPVDCPDVVLADGSKDGFADIVIERD